MSNVPPTVWCAIHAKEFRAVDQEVDDDGTQQLIKQYWKAECGCSVEIIMPVPSDFKAN